MAQCNARAGVVGQPIDAEPPTSPGGRARFSLPRWGLIAVFLGPTILFFVGLTIYPVVRTVYNSFFTIRPRGQNVFVGWNNYVSAADDSVFLQSVINTLQWAVLVPLIEVVLGLVLALFIYAKIPFARFFRIAWFAPVLVSYVVVAIMWGWLFNSDWGLINAMLRAIGLAGWQQAWLSDPNLALSSLMFVDVWKWTGFNMIICLAALHGLPSEVMEAAELDNCGWPQKLYFIIVPMIAPTLVGVFVLGFIGKMKVFDLVWIMTGGGPLWSTETVSTYVFKRAFNWSTFDLGYPSAIATAWFLVIFTSVSLVMVLLRRREKLEY